MTTRRFKAGDEVVIPNLLVNSTRMDVTGTVTRYLYSGGLKRKLKVEVLFNECYLLLDEANILTAKEYHDRKTL